MKTAIIIPARYGSTRFPGKPLAMIGGRSMLSRVVDAANEAARQCRDVSVFVTTEDTRIKDHAREIGAACIMTSADCATGSDRVLEAVQKSGQTFDVVINLQGDAPFTPPDVIVKIMEEFRRNPGLEVVTPVHLLSWEGLDRLREEKKSTPFSGTTVAVDRNGRALWFSKNIIPAIRKENREDKKSPVLRHIGLYGFRADILEKFCALPQSRYEKLEGLEQLRLIENGIAVHTVAVEAFVDSGIDTPEDLARAAAKGNSC